MKIIYIVQAVAENVELIAFPEFFTTGFAVNPKLIEAIIDTESSLEQMKSGQSNTKLLFGAHIYGMIELQKMFIIHIA